MKLGKLQWGKYSVFRTTVLFLVAVSPVKLKLTCTKIQYFMVHLILGKQTNIGDTHSELCSIHVDACYADICSGTGDILVERNAQCLELLSYHSCPYERGWGVLRRANGAIEKQAGQVEVHGCRL